MALTLQYDGALSPTKLGLLDGVQRSAVDACLQEMVTNWERREHAAALMVPGRRLVADGLQVGRAERVYNATR